MEEEDIWNENPQQPPAGNHSVVNELPSVQSASLTSGRTAKVETGVIRPVVWPHTHLAGCIANPSFDRLDFENRELLHYVFSKKRNRKRKDC